MFSNTIWWVWPSWLRRQIVALKIVGSSPIIHPRKEKVVPFGTAFSFLWVFVDVGLERPLRKQSGGLFLGRGKVLWMAECSSQEL